MSEKKKNEAVNEEADTESTTIDDAVNEILEDAENDTEFAFANVAPTPQPSTRSIPLTTPNHISEIGEDSDDVAKRNASEKSAEEIEAETWLKLQRDKRNGAVKRGFVIGVKPMERMNTVFFLTKVYGMTVYIPDYEYFMPSYQFSNDYEQKSEKEKFLERKNRAQYDKGARIMFVITELKRTPIPKEMLEEHDSWDSKWMYTIGGSRKQAMDIAVYAKFYNPNRDPRKNPMPKVGDVVHANVLSVRPDGARVEALGVETFVSNFELTGLTWVENAQDELAPGDRFKAKIQRLRVSPEGVRMMVSGRNFDTGETSKNILHTYVGDYYRGVVRNYNPKSHTYTINLDNDVICAVNESAVVNGVILEPGDIVSVEVKDVLAEYVRGVAMKV